MIYKIKLLFAVILLFTITTKVVIGQSARSFEVKGMIEGVADGTKIYLLYSYDTAPDSTVIKNNSFVFKGKVKEPVEAAVFPEPIENIGDRTKRRIFWLENARISIKGHISNLEVATVTGSDSNKDYELYYDELYRKHTVKGGYNDSVKTILTIKFIEEHPDSYKSAWELYLYRQLIPFGKVKMLYDHFSDRVKRSSRGQTIADFIHRYKQLQVGDLAPDFTLPGMNDTATSLSSFKGKYVLIVFWGSWCAPCRSENRKLNAFYHRFRSKNIEILGVGLDSREALTKAIEQDKVEWLNVYDNKIYDSPVAMNYGIWAVPDNFLLDPQGRILCRRIEFFDVNGEIIVGDAKNNTLQKLDELLLK